MRVRVLHLTLLRRWFDAIARGEKREEYRRKSSPRWQTMLAGRIYDEVHFRNGYNPGSPWMRVECLGICDGEYQGEPVFVIKLGRVLEVRQWLSQTPLPPMSSPSSPGSATSSIEL